MNITKESRALSVKEKYTMTMSPKIQRMKDVIGQQIEVAAWATYEDADSKTGELKTILSIMTPEGKVVATNSATFMRDFDEILDIICDAEEEIEVPTIEVITGTSKAGREFITCALI